MAQPTVYFDTNLFGMIADRDDAGAVADFLRSRSLVALASHQKLFEILAIRNLDRLAQELALLRTLVRPIEERPLAYRQAVELRNAIRRRHPEWLRGLPNTTQIKRFLHAHKANWRLSLSHAGIAEHARDAYRAASRRGIEGSRDAQRHWRKAKQSGGAILTLASGSNWSLEDANRGWRADA